MEGRIWRDEQLSLQSYLRLSAGCGWDAGLSHIFQAPTRCAAAAAAWQLRGVRGTSRPAAAASSAAALAARSCTHHTQRAPREGAATLASPLHLAPMLAGRRCQGYLMTGSMTGRSPRLAGPRFACLLALTSVDGA